MSGSERTCCAAGNGLYQIAAALSMFFLTNTSENSTARCSTKLGSGQDTTGLRRKTLEFQSIKYGRCYLGCLVTRAIGFRSARILSMRSPFDSIIGWYLFIPFRTATVDMPA